MFEDLIYHASFLLPSIIISRSWTNLTKDFKTNISWLVFVFYIFSVVGGGNSSEILSSTYIGNVLAMILIPNIIMLAYFKITGKEIRDSSENKSSKAEKKNAATIKKDDLRLKDFEIWDGIDASTKVKLIIIFILSFLGIIFLIALSPLNHIVPNFIYNYPRLLVQVIGFSAISLSAFVVTFLIFRFVFIKEFNNWYDSL
tara:strand:- start:60 stop:659 length:600 start_codon:yes stop_codon:yes gene_type:complete